MATSLHTRWHYRDLNFLISKWSCSIYKWTDIFMFLICSTTDSYSEVVPIDGPPSFRGQAVKYVYKLTIGCQRVNSPIKLLRVPFRVLVLQGEMTLDHFWPQILVFCTFSAKYHISTFSAFSANVVCHLCFETTGGVKCLPLLFHNHWWRIRMTKIIAATSQMLVNIYRVFSKGLS